MPFEKQQQPSQIEVKINFMKNPEMISQLRSKANHRTISPNNLSVVCDITDGHSLMVQTEDGLEDWTSELVGQTANLRLTQEQFDTLNEEIHNLEGVGASVQYELACDIRVDWLTTKKDGEVLAIAIYPESLIGVEPVVIQKVGSILSKESLRRGLKEGRERKERNRKAAVSTKVARSSADSANAKDKAEIFI